MAYQKGNELQLFVTFRNDSRNDDQKQNICALMAIAVATRSVVWAESHWAYAFPYSQLCSVNSSEVAQRRLGVCAECACAWV